MAQLNALAVAQSSAPSARPPRTAVTKMATVLIVIAVLGVVGMLLLVPRGAAPVKELPAAAQTEVSRPAVLEPPQVDAPPLGEPAGVAPLLPALRPAPAAPLPAMAPALKLPPVPPRLARAAENLPLTCVDQRDVLVALIRDHGHDDPEAAAAALSRWTLLCRTVSGPAIDDYRWFWPWGLAPTNSGSTCKTVLEDPSCDEGANITDSIAGAARCVSATTPGSCARRAARLQAVFAASEGLMHERKGAPATVDEAVTELTNEFGAGLGLAAAVWCLNPAAQQERLRLRQER